MLQDFRYARRVLSRNKAWTAMVVLTLSLGIGANTALFTAVNGFFLRKLSVEDPDTLVRLQWTGPNDMVIGQSVYGRTNPEGGVEVQPNFSYPMFQELRKSNQTMIDLFAGAPIQVNLVADGEAEFATAYLATGNYHGLLGVRAVLGRTILPGDDEPGADPVAVISHGFWSRRFGSDPGVLGKVIHVNNVPVAIVGVISPEFKGVERVIEVPRDLSLPLVLDTRLTIRNQNTPEDAPPRMTQPTTWWLHIMGRLKPGMTSAQVEANLGGVFQQAAREGMDSLLSRLSADQRANFGLQNPTRAPRLRVRSGAKGIYDLDDGIGQALTILGIVVALLLLIVCANVANLMLSRAATRVKEISIRLSLGATRLRVIRQLLSESVLLALLGGAVGVLIALWAKELLLSLDADLPLDWRVLSFAFVLSLATGVFSGITPALRATRNIGGALQETSAALAGSRAILTGSLLVAQVAVSLVLLIAAGLFLRTVENLRRVNMGFNPDHLVLFRVNPRMNGYNESRMMSLYDDMTEALGAVPGVRNVTVSNTSLMEGNYFGSNILVPGRTIERGPQTAVVQIAIAPNFFETMEIPLIVGRAFTAADDRSRQRVAIINEAARRKFFPNENPIGQRFGHSAADMGQIEIVGVVRDTKFNRLREDAPALLYKPLRQVPLGSVTFAMRVTSDPALVMPAIREAVRQVDANVSLRELITQGEQIENRFVPERLFARAYSVFGGLALLLASIGLFGVMSFRVARRTKEIGIRLALGAKPADVLRLVMRESMALVSVGTAIGLGIALAAGRLAAALVFGVKPTDFVTFAVAISVLVAVSLLAGYLPARKASRVDPMAALRFE